MNFGGVLLTGLGLIVGLAIVSVVLSKNAQTPAVFQAGGSALGTIIGAAVAPVSGSTTNTFGGVGQNTAGTPN
jgi:hypothetical protein